MSNRMSQSSQHPLFNQYGDDDDFPPQQSHQQPRPYEHNNFAPLPTASYGGGGYAPQPPTHLSPQQQYGQPGFVMASGSDERLQQGGGTRPNLAGMRTGSAPTSQGRTTLVGGQPTAKRRSACSLFCNEFNTPNQITFLSLILFQACAVLAIIALVYATINIAIGSSVPLSDTFDSDPKLETVATYLGLFILAELFEMLVTLDALHQKNIMQLLLLLLFQVAMIVYSSFLPSQLRNALLGTTADTPSVHRHVHGYSIAIPIVIAVVTTIMSFMTWRLYGEFGWDVFKRIGADLKLKRMYFLYQVFVCLLKFDAFFFIGFSIQFLVLVSGTPTVEFVITIASLPIILACLLLAALAVRREIKWMIYIFWVLDVAGVAYFLYKLVRIFDPTSGDRYDTAKKTLTIFSVISVLMLLLTFIIIGLCYKNFDNGLKESIPPYSNWGRSNSKRRKGRQGEYGGEGGVGGRVKDELEMERHSTRMSLE